MCQNANNDEKTTPENFEERIEAALDKIELSISKVLVNLFGLYNVSQVFTFTEGMLYCNAKESI